MKFKTQQGNDTYVELVNDISKRVSQMYEDLRNNGGELDYEHRFHLTVRIEEYRNDSLSRAAITATTVDTAWCGLQGGMMLASMREGE